MDQKERQELSKHIVKQLHHTGHFLHYRMGGKVGQRRILTTLLEQGEMLQKTLQEVLKVQSGSLSEMVIKLEGEGLIEKGKSLEDGRNLVLRLTERGRAQAVLQQQEYEEQVKRLTECLTEEQLQELRQLLGLLLEHWAEER